MKNHTNNQLRPLTYILILLSFILFIGIEAAKADEFSFETPSLDGAGCKEGTTDVIMSPDNQAISILFDEFSASVPQFDGDNDNDESNDPDQAPIRSNPNLDHKVCNIILAAKIPAGKRVESLDVTYDFRGYTFAEAGVRAVFNSVLIGRSGLGLRQGRKGATQLERKNWNGNRGEVDEDWNIGSTHAIPVRSGCSTGEDNKVTFRMKNTVAARINKGFEDLQPSGSVMMDSADITGKMKFKITLAPCHHGGGGRVRPPRPPRRRDDRWNGRGGRGQRCGRHMVYNPRLDRCVVRPARRWGRW